MKIVDLTDDLADLYFVCLEDWSEELREAGDDKARWYEKMRSQGLGVKLALDDEGRAGGMIQYIPIEHSPAEGQDLYFILCIWVHGHRQGRGNFQGRGMGKALLQAAEVDAEAKGARGIAAWGLWLPVWMKASWFRKRGYVVADRVGIQVLLWKPFCPEAVPPRWFREKKRPAGEPGKVCVTSFRNGWCPVQNMICHRARRAAEELGPPVQFEQIDTSERATFLDWGIADALFIDGQPVRTGPPPAYQQIRSAIARRVHRLSK